MASRHVSWLPYKYPPPDAPAHESWAYPPCAAPEGVNAQMSDTKEFVTGFVGILIMVVIFFALIGTILDQIANTTLTGAALPLGAMLAFAPMALSTTARANVFTDVQAAVADVLESDNETGGYAVGLLAVVVILLIVIVFMGATRTDIPVFFSGGG